MKYKLTENKKEINGVVLHRIECVTAFGNVKQGEKGGWIEKEDNLSQEDGSWVYGNAWVSGDAVIKKEKDYLVFKNNWSSGRYFTWTKSNNMWRVGCFYGTGKELIDKAYKDSKLSGDCYKETVEYVERLNELTNNFKILIV